MRHHIRVRALAPVLAAVTAVGVLAGCGTEKASTPEVKEAPAAGATTAAKDKTAAKAAASLGEPGTACVLPVSFGLAADWKPKAVKVDEGDELAVALGKQGPATMVCEIDAKPAGNIGYLRVWTAPGGSARTALEGFVKAEENTSKVSYKETKAGALPVVEVTYTVYNKIMEESKEESAFAVSTPKGTVIVHLGGLDSEEHREMLPAYELARSSVKAL
ncbi:lipoprotein [Streptomyces sp. NPDC006551]|uniref:lipoprotein n=1 Tax=Streptomyces sp. NPDC006551 TaxID=3157178 RepID=UPI0033A7C9F3